MIVIEQEITPEWDPLGFKNNLLELSNLAANLHRSDGATTKSTLALLLLRWIERGLVQDYPIPNLFSTKQGQQREGGSSYGPSPPHITLNSPIPNLTDIFRVKTEVDRNLIFVLTICFYRSDLNIRVKRR